MKLWKIVSVCELLIFIIGILFLWFREVDGSGAVNTSDNKFASITVVAITFAILAIIQFIWFKVIKKRDN
ncbi:hypothetical protein BAU15_09970 [Enterococcus sp. JM4C]|uniref:DUF3923 family protein n=1 Tax=Candidatus Enterococcus huntleyi TaxID=1857217 RepID=UPI00137A5997|nr:DUF3923 family protein [Enterococcus sp. JM4C]KAF1298162.1 hypothetical protein BAU15_09970 [Enterococcus sp. JM4C]